MSTFTIDTKEFKAGLFKIKPAIDKGNLPIFTNARLRLKDGDLELTGFNGVIAIISKITLIESNIKELNTLVNFETLDKVVKKLKGDTIIFKLEGSQIEIIQKSFNFKLPTQSTEEYTEPPIFVQSPSFKTIDWQKIEAQLELVSECTSLELSKQILTGVSFKLLEDGTTEIAATDGHRLLVSNLGLDFGLNNIVIPKELIMAAIAAFKNDSQIDIAVEDNLVRFESNSTVIIGFAILGSYPEYSQLMPTRFIQEVNLDYKEFIQAIDTVAPLSDSNLIISFHFKEENQSLEISCKSEMGTAIATLENVPIKEDINICFSLKYILLKGLTKENKAVFKINEPPRPSIISFEAAEYLIMPVIPRG